MAKKILFFSCEPGGAEVLIPVINLLQSRSFEVTVATYGYAVERFKKKNVSYVEIEAINEDDFGILEEFKPDLVISSATSLPYKDMSEKYLWQNARKMKIKTGVFLDQWQNYSIRFSGIREDEKLRYLPDFINCINDIGKQEMISEGFNENILLTFGHPYLSSLGKEAEKIDTKSKKKYLQIEQNQKVFLFVSEAIKENYGNTIGYDQYKVLDFFLDNIQNIPNSTVIIKLHPKDDIKNFKNIISKYKNLHLIFISNEISPIECIMVSDFIYGMTSIMLIEAYILGKNVISLQPNLKINDPLVISRYNYISIIDSYMNFNALDCSYKTRKRFDFQFLENNFLKFLNKLLRGV